MSPASAPRPAPVLDVDALLSDPATTTVVCCGSGGVGKTTTAAALALRAAELGRSVVVLTIDPARRLAQSMGLTELSNTPSRVAGVDPAAGGTLDAMMLDMKRTFDDVVLAATTPEKAEAIFANPFYVSLSSSFSGTQEYMAMEKLGQLKSSGSWELIVVDTPPTRSALDFLDAPKHLTTFLDGRMLKILLAPAKAGGKAYLKVVSASLSVFTRMLTKIIGAQVLTDLSHFVAALETMFGGFRERADATYELLAAPGTAFVVVASPEPAALREAAFFVDRLAEEHMPLAGLVLNRVHRTAAPQLTRERALAAAEVLVERAGAGGGGGGAGGGGAGAGGGGAPGGGDAAATAEGILRVHAARVEQAQREQRLRERFTGGHPAVPLVEVGALAGDVHDLDGLRGIGRQLAGRQEPDAPGDAVA